MTPGRRAFTLLELLVTVGIVALLASLVVVAIGGVSDAANRTDSSNALRSMMTGFTVYSTDHKQRLLPGYVDAAGLESLGISPKLVNGSPVDPNLEGPGNATDPNDASSYVWRLAPYLDHDWRVVMKDYSSGSIDTRLDLELIGGQRSPCNAPTIPVYGPGTAADAGCDDLGISRVPSFGMNSIFVGGDNVHGGAAVVARNPWTPSDPGDVLAATRLSEVKNPSHLIVFAPARSWDNLENIATPASVSGTVFGAAELRPPFLDLDDTSTNPQDWVWNSPQWEVVGKELVDLSGNGAEFASPASDSGLPAARWGDRLPAARLDGSVVAKDLSEYAADMRMWSPWVTSTHKHAVP